MVRVIHETPMGTPNGLNVREVFPGIGIDFQPILARDRTHDDTIHENVKANHDYFLRCVL